jgi:hypothetical protein
MKILSTFFLIGTIFLGCNSNLNSETSSDYSEGMEQVALEPSMMKQSIQLNGQTQETEAKIIKESLLRFETSSIEKTYKQVKKLVFSNNGIIQKDETNKNYNSIERRLTIRIPTNSFQKVIDTISNQVRVFDRKEISQRDVTEEFIDLEARLKSKRKLEARYLELLVKAQNVKEILEIEREVAKIREEIEAKQGRLNYLLNKVSLSTIQLSFYEQTQVEKPISQSYFNRIIKAFKGGFAGIENFFIGVLYIWPFIIIGVLATLFIRRKFQKRNKV